jgi:hypothetical protein
MPVRKVAAIEGHSFRILEEWFAFGEFPSESTDSLRLHSQEWLCHTRKKLFVTEGFDGVELGGFGGGPDSKN